MDQVANEAALSGRPSRLGLQRGDFAKPAIRQLSKVLGQPIVASRKPNVSTFVISSLAASIYPEPSPASVRTHITDNTYIHDASKSHINPKTPHTSFIPTQSSQAALILKMVKPTTCCGRADSCLCAEKATCSCGKQSAMNCTCEKKAQENSISGARCSCRKSFLFPLTSTFDCSRRSSRLTRCHDRRETSRRVHVRPCGDGECERQRSEVCVREEE
jgi:hypothetical protein